MSKDVVDIWVDNNRSLLHVLHPNEAFRRGWQASRQSLPDEVTDEQIGKFVFNLCGDWPNTDDIKSVRDWLRKIGGAQ